MGGGGEKGDVAVAGAGGAVVIGLLACTPEPPEVCKQYVACAGVAAPESFGTLHATYGEGGTCWRRAAAPSIGPRSCRMARPRRSPRRSPRTCPGPTSSSSPSRMGDRECVVARDHAPITILVECHRPSTKPSDLVRIVEAGSAPIPPRTGRPWRSCQVRPDGAGLRAAAGARKPTFIRGVTCAHWPGVRSGMAWVGELSGFEGDDPSSTTGARVRRPFREGTLVACCAFRARLRRIVFETITYARRLPSSHGN